MTTDLTSQRPSVAGGEDHLGVSQPSTRLDAGRGQLLRESGARPDFLRYDLPDEIG
jgi:hypothetical protein